MTPDTVSLALSLDRPGSLYEYCVEEQLHCDDRLGRTSAPVQLAPRDPRVHQLLAIERVDCVAASVGEGAGLVPKRTEELAEVVGMPVGSS